tara:strand:- start:1954 stop:2076 length:123 start_codon:yes stop_codon:yes gene_type:complete
MTKVLNEVNKVYKKENPSAYIKLKNHSGVGTTYYVGVKKN